MSDNEVTAKFMSGCTPRLGPTRADHALQLLWNLDKLKNLDDLFAAFAQA